LHVGGAPPIHLSVGHVCGERGMGPGRHGLDGDRVDVAIEDERAATALSLPRGDDIRAPLEAQTLQLVEARMLLECRQVRLEDAHRKAHVAELPGDVALSRRFLPRYALQSD